MNLDAAYYVQGSHSTIQPTYNSVGQTGLIHLPTASIQSESAGVTIGNSLLNQFLSINGSPYRWLEASFFFHRVRNTGQKNGIQYLDKGFNLKIGSSYKNIDFAIGLDDLSGTGYLSKEYFVSTANFHNYSITLGFGTGALAGDNGYENPIPRLRIRPQKGAIGASYDPKNSNQGGEIDFNTFFRGPVGIFGGIEFYSSKYPGLAFKIESNPYDYNTFLGGGKPTPTSIRDRKKKRDINYGIYYKFRNNLIFSLSEIKGNSFDLSISMNLNFNKKRPKPKVSKIITPSNSQNKKLAFYQNMLRNFERDDLYLQFAELKDESLLLGMVNNKYSNPIDMFLHTKKVVNELSQIQDIDVSELSITTINTGIETGTFTADLKNTFNQNDIGFIAISEPKNLNGTYDFQTISNFPEFYSSIEPELIFRYGDPYRFFAGGLDIQLNQEIKFAPSFYLTTGLSYQLYDSYERLRYNPASPFLQHVRTDVVQYLRNRSDIFVNNFQIDKLSKLSNDHYFKLSAGMYEMMFGGYGIEYIWKPFTRNIITGLNIYKVKQRDFKQVFGFQDYEVTTGHANFIYLHPKSGLNIDLSVGKYLAGDIGYTFDLSRKFKSGFQMGAYFTRTNISKVVFGEGSFDKGFYFEMPFTIFSSLSPNTPTRFLIQPLTRDGGAKLKTTNPLIYFIRSSSEADYNFYLD